MAPTAVVSTITADTAMPTMKRCQLDSHLAPAPAPVMTYHHGRREPLMAATIELCSRQATEETVSPFRLTTGVTRMKGISVVLFSSFLVARNRVMAPLLYVLQLPTSGRSSGTGCDIPRSPPQYSGRNNGYGTNRGPQQQYGSGSRSYRSKPFVRHL